MSECALKKVKSSHSRETRGFNSRVTHTFLLKTFFLKRRCTITKVKLMLYSGNFEIAFSWISSCSG